MTFLSQQETLPLPITPALEPCGDLIEGKPGVSASRIARILRVTVPLIKQVADPIGIMKKGKMTFDVYEAGLVATLRTHPAFLQARKRKDGQRKETACDHQSTE